MSTFGRRTLRSAAATLFATICIGANAHGSELQPFQLVRSLQLVQDRLADGDHAALPMQRKLLEMIDGRMVRADPAEFGDGRNYRALLIYAMSGGNPATIGQVVARLDLTGEDARLGEAVTDYVTGRIARAGPAFEPVDPLAYPSELGSFLALIKGTVAAATDPDRAWRNFDLARLLAPGTLVEEAALRRLLSLHAQRADAPRFQSTAMHYVTRFLRSPYATQFAEAYVAGIVRLHETIDTDSIEETTALMNDEQTKVIYLRLARRSAVEGYPRLLAFASRMAGRWANPQEGSGDPRAQLYASIGSITSENVGTVLDTLKSIDRSRLTEDDRSFLSAAEAIAATVTAPPPGLEGRAPPPQPVVVAKPEPAVTMPPETPIDDGPVASILSDGRARLEAIDRLLEETAQ